MSEREARGRETAPETQLDQLYQDAAAVLNEHIAEDGRCVACGVDWPCRQALVAANNLALS